jgi:hypothetical protein
VKLGIVGHAQEKFTPLTERLARDAIIEAIIRHHPEQIISGRSPMGGVDLFAEDIARQLHIPFLAHVPRVDSWHGDGGPPSEEIVEEDYWKVRREWSGFRTRNLAIARDSSVVLCVVVTTLPPGFEGMAFGDGCYHCAKHVGAPPPHVKSGGCWTAWKCRRHEWHLIEGNS